MKSNLITKRETAALLGAVSKKWAMNLPHIKNLKIHHITDDAQLITGNGIKILHVGGQYLPFLSDTTLLEKFPRVIVDMGAVRFMCKGANVMRPGIKSHSDFARDDIVCVVEESQHKFLAVGKAMVSGDDVDKMDRGEVLKNLHYISDTFWDIAKTIND